jgi:hypothetical protein
MWRTAKQVLKEYWLAFVVGLIWTVYVGGFTAKLYTYIGNFAGAFFLTSWMLGQINRIKRDHETKDALARLEATLAAFEVSLGTISRWTNGKAYIPTATLSTTASTSTSEVVSDIVPGTRNDPVNGADNVVDFNKYRLKHLGRLVESRFDLAA